jgi:hypothetical protein
MSAHRRPGEETREPGHYVYHYSREERLSRKPQEAPEADGFIKRNRSLLIVLLDIVLILVVFVLYLLFFHTAPTSTEMDGFIVDGNAFVFDGDIYLTLSITRGGNAVLVPQDDMLVEVSFPGGRTLVDALPIDPDYPATIRHVVTGESARDPSRCR